MASTPKVSTPTSDYKSGNETEPSHISPSSESIRNVEDPGNSSNTLKITTENVKNEIIVVPSEGNVVPVAPTSDDSIEELYMDRIIKVSKLSNKVSADEVYKLLQLFGSIEDACIKTNPSPANDRYAFITFKYPEDANSLLKFDKPLFLKGSALEFTSALYSELNNHQCIQPGSEKVKSPVDIYTVHRIKQPLIIREVKGVCDGKEILQGGDKDSFIGRLDKKCLVQIFSFININELNTIATVCKRWSVLVNETWKNVTKLDGNVNPELFQSSFMLEQVLNRCGATVKEICVGSENIITASFYSVITKNAKELEALTIENNCTKTESLRIIASNCVGIKKLTIRNCIGLTDEGLRSIFETNPGIEILVLEDAKIRGRSLKSGLRRLKSLTLIKCKLLRPKYILQVLENTTVRMEKLELIECFKFLERHIVRAMLRSPDVKTLIIEGAYFGKDVLLYPVFHMTFLKKISLPFSNAITPELIHGLKEHCLQLTDINLDGLGECSSRIVSPKVFTKLGQITQLQHISISYSPLINSLSLAAFIPNMTNLKTARFAACTRMDTISVPSMLLQCLNLKLLDVSGSIRSRRILFARVMEKIDKLIERKTTTVVLIGEFDDLYAIEDDEIPDIPNLQFVGKSSLDRKPVESNFDHYLWDKLEDSDNESTEDILPEDYII